MPQYTLVSVWRKRHTEDIFLRTACGINSKKTLWYRFRWVYLFHNWSLWREWCLQPPWLHLQLPCLGETQGVQRNVAKATNIRREEVQTPSFNGILDCGAAWCGASNRGEAPAGCFDWCQLQREYHIGQKTKSDQGGKDFPQTWFPCHQIYLTQILEEPPWKGRLPEPTILLAEYNQYTCSTLGQECNFEHCHPNLTFQINHPFLYNYEYILVYQNNNDVTIEGVEVFGEVKGLHHNYRTSTIVRDVNDKRCCWSIVSLFLDA